MKPMTLHDLMIDELRDMYDAEQRLVKALPKLAKAAHHPDLADAFKNHLAETVMHVKRLEQAFIAIGETPKRKTCNGMKGLLKEGDEFLKEKSIPKDVRDAGLISAAQRVEHYEIAGYGCLIAFAKQMGHTDVVDLLTVTLDEEKQADTLLSVIAETSVNADADLPSRSPAMKGKKEKEPAMAA